MKNSRLFGPGQIPLAGEQVVRMFVSKFQDIPTDLRLAEVCTYTPMRACDILSCVTLPIYAIAAAVRG